MTLSVDVMTTYIYLLSYFITVLALQFDIEHFIFAEFSLLNYYMYMYVFTYIY